MAKIKTSELAGTALDWAVAKCEGETEEETLDPLTWKYTAKPTGCWDFSSNWSRGGPIIERENICIRGVSPGFYAWYANNPPKMHGPTMLIAAMRCYCCSKLGDVVDVPEELCQSQNS